MSAIGIKFEPTTHIKVKLVAMARNMSIQNYVMGLIQADLNTADSKLAISMVMESLEGDVVVVKPKHKNSKKK